MTRRIKISVAIVAAVAVIGGYAGYWFFVAAQLEKGIDDWAALQRQAGLTVAFERSGVTGFPLAFRATFRQPHIVGALGGQPFDWRGPDTEAWVSPLDLTAMTFIAPGHHTIDLGAGPAEVDARDLSARLAFGSGKLSSVAVDFADIKATLPDRRVVAAAAGTASLSTPPAPPKTDADVLMQFAVDAKDLKLPDGIVLLSADPVSAVKIAGTVKGPMLMAPLRPALTAWRDAGGTVEVTSFAASQATLSLSGSATVALDDNLQPIVAADVKARGLAPTIDLLVSQHRLYAEDALKMKLFVKGAERDAPGGYKEVATGLTLQSGYLYWGPFKLAPVPPIQWPQ